MFSSTFCKNKQFSLTSFLSSFLSSFLFSFFSLLELEDSFLNPKIFFLIAGGPKLELETKYNQKEKKITKMKNFVENTRKKLNNEQKHNLNNKKIKK